MRGKIFRRKEVVRHTEKMQYPAGVRRNFFGAGTRARLAKEKALARQQASEPDPEARRKFFPVPFQPITGNKPNHRLPKVKPSLYDSRMLTQRFIPRKEKEAPKKDRWRLVSVRLDHKEYKLLEQASEEWVIPIAALLRLMVRRFVRKGVILSGSEINASISQMKLREQTAIRRLLDEGIFINYNRGPDRVLHNAKRMKTNQQLAEYQRLRRITPKEKWEVRSLDTYKHFVQHYFADGLPLFNKAEHRDNPPADLAAHERALARKPLRRLPEPGPLEPQSSPEEDRDQGRDRDNVVSFPKKRLIIRRKEA